MAELIIHPETQSHIDAYLGAPAHALLLVGPGGSGKLSLAKKTAEAALQLKPGSFDSYGYSYVMRSDEGKAISVEAAHQLEHFLSLKVPSKTVVNRVVIVEDSQLLTVEAQNALLKTIEEPPEGTILILTAHHNRSLLPTIHSRLQTIDVRRPTRLDLEKYFIQKGFDDAQVRQVFAMSGGLPGLMQALLDDENHPLRIAARQVRELLGQSVFQRLAGIDALSRQKELAVDMIDILQQMAHISLQTADGAAAAHWRKILRASYDAAEAIRSSAQLKLVLTDMVLKF